MIPTNADPGMVRNQVVTISPALPQRTALGRSEVPMPRIAELVTWVVDTGAPMTAALKMIAAALAWLILTRQWFLIFKPARRKQEPMLDLLLQGDLVGALARMETRQESQILGLPLWPTYIVAEVCVLAFFVVACVCVWRSARAFLSAPHSESAA